MVTNVNCRNCGDQGFPDGGGCAYCGKTEPGSSATSGEFRKVDLTNYSTPLVYSNSAAVPAPPAATPSPGGQVDERALFEREANAARFLPREIDFSLTKSPSGRDEYANSHLQSRWEGWQARSTLTQQAAPEAPTDAKDRRILFLEGLLRAYGPKSLQYDIEHPNDGLNATAAPVAPASEQQLIDNLRLALSLARDGISDETVLSMVDKALAASAVTSVCTTASTLTYTVDGVVMEPLEYIDYLHAKLASAVPQIKTWQDRCDWSSDEPATKLMVGAMKDEITDLRAALSGKPPC